jgi:site-specific DNA-cytosine methylase
MTYVSACEINRHCSKVLIHRGTSHNCVFKDIMEFCPGLPGWPELRQLSWQDRLKLVRKHFRQGPCKCWRHTGPCSVESCDFDFSGSPCQPWSFFGSRGGLSDPRSLFVLVWIAMILASMPAVAVHECTIGFNILWLRVQCLVGFRSCMSLSISCFNIYII